MRSNESPAYKRRVVLLLTLAYTLNSADRTLIAIIGQPLKLDLRLTDTQLGMLIGTAFACLYAFSGLPIARLAERFNRVAIITAALTAWSLLTAFCGLATTFLQLFMLRMAVGVGESGCTPPAHSLISDYVEPTRRSTALSVYSCGISFGYILSALLGGYVGLHFGWRMACIVIGLPGLLVAVLLKWAIAEPLRGPSNLHLASGISVAGELAELGSVAKSLIARAPVGHLLVGLLVATFAAQGSYAFVPAYFSRAFGLDYGTIGLISAISGGAAVGVGLVVGGLLTDALGRHDAKWYGLVPALGLLIATPLYVLSFWQAGWMASAVLLSAAGFFQYVSFGPTFGVLHNVVDARRRATATAVVYIFLTLLGLGAGPPFTGWLIDHFAQVNLQSPGAHSVFAAFEAALLGHGDASISFKLNCAVGVAPGAGTLPTICAQSLALASRQGLIVSVLLYGWAAVHYFLGSAGLYRLLPRESSAATRTPETP